MEVLPISNETYNSEEGKHLILTENHFISISF